MTDLWCEVYELLESELGREPTHEEIRIRFLEECEDLEDSYE